MTNRRSNNVLYVGVGVFAVGAVLAFFGLRSQDHTAAVQHPVNPVGTPNSSVRTIAVANAPALTFVLPKGKQAVAVEMPSVPGLAGYAKPGDTVNVYATIKNGQPNGKLRQPLVKLVLAGVKVLDVRAPAPGTEGQATYLLALDVTEAEQVIFYAKFESLWIALTTPDQKPVSTTGRAYQNLL